jgi:type I restriction enzyme S subunit
MGKPKIRFKGFTEDWEQRKLPEFVEFFNGLTYMPNDVRESGTLVLRSSNVKNGEIVDADNVYVESEKVTSENVKVGDIIIVVRNGSRALIGKHAEIKENMPNTVIGAFMSGIRSKHASFVNALLDTSQFEKEIEKNMGATINQITGYMFSKMEFMIPSSVEQERIGDYFKSLDHLITLHQRKYDETKKLKKYMLQKMFPQNGMKVPEIRFEGFTGDWEQRKFEELYQRNVERNAELISYDKTISIATMSFKDEGNGASDDSLSIYKVLRIGDIAFEGHTNKQFRFGRFVVNDIGTGIMSPRFSTLRPVKEMSVDFWKQYIHHEPIMRKVLVNSTKAGTMMNELVIPEFLNQTIPVPKDEEQKKIGTYFSNLDHLITLHQRKCDELVKIKKYMLQNMFV